VQGDLLVSGQEIGSYLRNLRNPTPPILASEELIINAPGGKLDFIVAPDDRHMVYAVDRASFPTDAAANFAQSKFRDAATDWENRCPECGVSFTEKQLADLSGLSATRTFIIRFQNVPGGPIATSFFPSSAPSERIVAIFPGYLATDLSFDPVGVLRHEIGHILGYRHEHIFTPTCGNSLPNSPVGTTWPKRSIRV
jgi:hypothetical protein